jgi:hypothetical protein
MGKKQVGRRCAGRRNHRQQYSQQVQRLESIKTALPIARLIIGAILVALIRLKSHEIPHEIQKHFVALLFFA